MRRLGLSLALLLLAGASLAQTAEPPRFKTLAPDEMTPDQRRVADAIASGPRGGLRGPFNALLRSPELADRAQKVGEYIRFNSSLPARLNEFAILITAREWGSEYEWYAHHPPAVKGGLDPAIATALAENREPAGMKPDEAIVYRFCRELLETRQVSDETFRAATEALGERGVIDLVGVTGYYGLVSMILNVDRHPLPAGVAPVLKPAAR
jgi:4-carboxymuconolactone decarboxylase